MSATGFGGWLQRLWHKLQHEELQERGGAARTLERQLSASDGAHFVKGQLHGRHAGRDWRFVPTSNASAVLHLGCIATGGISFSRWTRLDRLCAPFFPREAFETGDPRFDAIVLVQTDQPELARRWLRHDHVRRVILEPGELGPRVTGINLGNGSLSLWVKTADLRGPDAGVRLHALLDQLIGLVEPLEQEPLARRSQATVPKRWTPGAILFVAALVLFGLVPYVYFLMLVKQARYWSVDMDALVAAGVIAALAGLATAPLYALHWRRLSAPWRMVALETVGTALMIGAFTPLALLMFDGFTSPHPVHEWTFRIEGVEAEAPFDVLTVAFHEIHVDEVRHWPVLVARHRFDEARPGRDLVRLRLQRGRLGWIRHVEPPELLATPDGAPAPPPPPFDINDYRTLKAQPHLRFAKRDTPQDDEQ